MIEILSNYVAILCQKGGVDVRLARVDQQKSRNDVYPILKKLYPDWNIKSVQRLYYEDFAKDEWYDK